MCVCVSVAWHMSLTFPFVMCFLCARRAVVIIDVNSEINDAEHRSGAPGSRKKRHVSTHAPVVSGDAR